MTRTVGRYEVVGHLAQGGMAEILLGRLVGPRGFEHPVVIKRILPNLARSAEFVDMFTDEASILAAIRHKNVVTVHEFGNDGDDLFLVLEYLEGESVGSLARRLWTRGEELDRRLGAYIIAEACAGIHAAHELTDDSGAPRELVHRDVSPQNVLVTYSGEVKVLDFGIAKAQKRIAHTEAGQLKGKSGYMSPEQCHGKPLDRRSDIFTLGTLLYELTTSRRLFKRESELDTLKAITEQSVTPPTSVVPDYPAALEVICLRALARKRDERYNNAADMRRDLLAWLHAQGGDRLPEEELARQMHAVFVDRIEEKRELLKKVRAGSGVTHIPDAEADELVELPTVDEPKTQATRATFAAPVPSRPARWGAVALAVALPAALGSWWLLRTEAPPVISSLPSAVPPAATALAAASARGPVALRIETTPPSASVIVAGEKKGTTPATISLPHGTAPVLVEVTRDGYESWSQMVVPEVDQSFVVNLRARLPMAPRPPRPAPPPLAPPAPSYEKL